MAEYRNMVHIDHTLHSLSSKCATIHHSKEEILTLLIKNSCFYYHNAIHHVTNIPNNTKKVGYIYYAHVILIM